LIKKFILSRLLWLSILFPKFIFGLDDFESWSSIGFEKNLPHSFSLSFKQGLRLKEQLSVFKQTLSELSISYKLLDNLKIEIPYRYIIYKNKTKHRVSLSASHKYKMMSFYFKHRIKYQRTYEKKEYLEGLIRNKMYVYYKLKKKLEPFISSEFFHFYEQGQYQFDELRLAFGFNINLSKKQSLKVSYTLKSKDLSKDISEQISIVLIAYSFRF